MKKCSACGKRIALGGEAFVDQLYCNEKCRKAGLLEASERYLSHDIIMERVMDIHHGPCPMCGKEGPNDVQWHYTVWSAIFVTSHKDQPDICCRGCGIKKKWSGVLFSGTLGWWGFPFGLLLTPAQLVRNFVSMAKSPVHGKPSRELMDMIRMEMGAMALLEAANMARQAAQPPPLAAAVPSPLDQRA